jgi:hypothetical protein
MHGPGRLADVHGGGRGYRQSHRRTAAIDVERNYRGRLRQHGSRWRRIKSGRIDRRYDSCILATRSDIHARRVIQGIDDACVQSLIPDWNRVEDYTLQRTGGCFPRHLLDSPSRIPVGKLSSTGPLPPGLDTQGQRTLQLTRS